VTLRPQFLSIPTLILLIGALTGCAAPIEQPPTSTPTPVTPTSTATDAPPPTATDIPTPTETPSPEPTGEARETEEPSPTPTREPTATPYPEDWKDWPIIPTVSEAMREIYQRGIEHGNDPHSFSVVGDCNSLSDYFLTDFDSPSQYRLGDENQTLKEAIDYFHGSFSRERFAVGGGFNAATVFSPLMADPENCNVDENPLECEFRLSEPSILIVSMGTNWAESPAEVHREYLGYIVEFALERDVVPILSTKADNMEGDHSINKVIVDVARDYDVPLWNFWTAADPLPDHGLVDDGFHLTYSHNYFDDPVRMESAWPVRNLTALQALDAVWRAVSDDDEG